jgi:hypothetical protein
LQLSQTPSDYAIWPKRKDWAKLIKEEKMHNKINKQLNRNAIFV